MALCRLVPMFRRSGNTIIHLHSSKAGALGRIAGFLTRRRCLVYTPHAFAFLLNPAGLRSRFYRHVERFLTLVTHHYLAVSESEKETCCRELRCSKEQVCVVANGVELNAMPTASFKSAEPIKLGFLGRFAAQKRPELLVELARILHQREVKFRVLFAGAGPRRERCEKLVHNLGLSRSFNFLGEISDVAGFYDEVDIMVSTSAYEGLPYFILDAMASSLPVAAFDVVGVRDLVIPGETGLLAPEGDMEALADHVERLIREAQLREKLGLAGRRRVAAHFSLSGQIEQLRDFYRSLVPAKQPAESPDSKG